MGIIDSIILTIYTLSLGVLSGLMIVAAIAPNMIQPHVWIEEALTSGWKGQMVVGLIGAAFFAVSVRLIVVAFKRQGGGQPVVHETDMGEVRISLDAVENLVRRTARSVKGVREIKAVVTNGRDGLSAKLVGTVSPEVSIPEVSEEIQNTVSRYVKRVVGVSLAEIQLEVENISNDGRRSRLD